jgi:protein-S-isoprenylcysteine O-methyltransferase Ste14
MEIYPTITFTVLNGFLLIIPLLGLRFGLPALIRKEALSELDHFPPVIGFERIALKVYFITNTFLIFSPLLAHIRGGSIFSWIGWGIYAIGVLLLAVSLLNFSTSAGGLTRTGVYRLSRNPMYVGYFLIFIGIALLIGSWFHLAVTLIYQVAVHFLILSEERWCQATFGEELKEYKRKVRRYL